MTFLAFTIFRASDYHWKLSSQNAVRTRCSRNLISLLWFDLCEEELASLRYKDSRFFMVKAFEFPPAHDLEMITLKSFKQMKCNDDFVANYACKRHQMVVEWPPPLSPSTPILQPILGQAVKLWVNWRPGLSEGSFGGIRWQLPTTNSTWRLAMPLNSRLIAHQWACALGVIMTTMAGVASVESQPILNKEVVDHAVESLFIITIIRSFL